MALQVTANSPSSGYIAWSGLTIVYKGTSYPINDGNTNAKYAWWAPATSQTVLQTGNTLPSLGEDDLLVFLNKSGTPVRVPLTTVLEGDLLVDGTVLARHLAASTVTADKIAALVIETAKYIHSSNFVTGSSGWAIEGDGTAEFNNVIVRGISLANTAAADNIVVTGGVLRSQNYVAGTSGWRVDGDGNAEFNNVTVRGAVESSTITGGVYRTQASGQRIEIDSAWTAEMRFYTGNASEDFPGALRLNAGSVWLEAPSYNLEGIGSYLYLNHTSNIGLFANNGEIRLGNTGDAGFPTLTVRDSGNDGIHLHKGWLRVDNNNGLYFQTHGGGWHMTDTTWIRAYNSKSIYTPATVRASSAAMQAWVSNGAYARFGHETQNTAGGYGVLQHSDSDVFISAAADSSRVEVRGGDNSILWCRWVTNVGSEIKLASTPALAGTTMVRNGTSGQIGPTSSSRRYKENINPMAAGALNPIFKVRPVRFDWNQQVRDLSPGEVVTQVPGLIAEEVAELIPAGAHYNGDGEPESLNELTLIALLIDAVQFLARGGRVTN